MATRQSWDPERYAANARFVSDLGAAVVDLLAPVAGERVLDVGCGDGALTERLVARGCAVVGIDSSSEQIRAALSRGLDARVADATALDFRDEFDAVFSNAALHWVREPDAAIACAWRALKPGGRFVGEFGGYGCVEQIRSALHRALARRGIDPALHDPWYFPTDGEYRARLEAAGFAVGYIALIPRPTALPGDVTQWLDTFCESFLAAVADEEHATVVAELREDLRPALCDSNGRWTADYVRLRFSAIKPRPA